MTVDWHGPQPQKEKRKRFKPMLDEVREQQHLHPDTWVLLASYASRGSASQLAYKVKRDHPGFDARSERAPDGLTTSVWVMWVGETDGE